MRTLICPQTAQALKALVRQLEDAGGSTNCWPNSLAVKSTTGKPLLNAVSLDQRQEWSVQVTAEVAQAFDLKVW